jgi:outer membrane protein assembly factor BamB
MTMRSNLLLPLTKLIWLLNLVLIEVLISSCNNMNSNNPTAYSMFRGDSKHQALSNSGEINSPPSLKWKFKTNGPVISSVTILGNKILFGSNDSCLYCLDRESGKQIWKYKTQGAVCSTPAVTNDAVYFLSYDGNLYAVNTTDGQLKWKYKTDGEKCFSAPGIHGRTPKDSVFLDDWDFFLSSPAIDDDAIYFGTGTGYFYSVDKNTGKEKWKFKTNGVIHSSPVLAFGNVYFGSWDTYLYALNAQTGSEVWKYKTGIDTVIYNQTGFQGSPVISDSMLYVGCRDSRLYALDAISGKKIWDRFNEFAWVSSTPIVSGDKVIYTTGDSRSLVALNKFTGDSIYQTPAPGWIFSSPSIAGNQIYFGDNSGVLNAMDLATGKKSWTYQLESSKKDKYKILNPDSTLNQDVVFNKDKKIKEGKTSMEMIFSLGAIISSPVIEHGNSYFGSTDGYLYNLH